MEVGRNDQCPCGSGRKYKNCFIEKNPDCSLFNAESKKILFKEHPEKDKLVFKFFSDAIDDIGTAFIIDPVSEKSIIAQRVQLIAVFTFIDVIASFWFQYLGEIKKPRERFESWVDRFCLTEANDDYANGFLDLKSFALYEFRSSLVHFFGVGGIYEGFTFAVAPNERSDKEIEDWREQFKKKGRPVIIFKPKSLHNFVIQGALLMLGVFKQNIDGSGIDESKKWAHVEGIDRVYKKIIADGAVKIKIPEK